jgi:predicted RecA/RadA family phage recombinase
MPYTNATGSAITKGTVIELPAMIGVTLGDIANGATGTLAITEVWTLPKDATVAISQGDQLYWDATSNSVDKTNTNIPCGKAFAAAAETATTVRVLLNA